MAGKKKTESSEVSEARKTVAAADREDRRNQDESTEVCSCNAHGGPHRHLDRGIIPVEPPKAEKGDEE